MSNPRKEMFERRERNAGRRNFANSQTLLALGYSEAQADAVSELCEFRHWLHCNQEDAFNPESTGYSRITDECSKFMDGTGGIVDRIDNLFGSAPFRRKDWPIDSYDLFVLEEDWNPPSEGRDAIPAGENLPYIESYRLEQLDKCIRIMGEINSEIETWLENLDKKIGTKCAPTGAHRMF